MESLHDIIVEPLLRQRRMQRSTIICYNDTTVVPKLQKMLFFNDNLLGQQYLVLSDAE